MSFFETKMTFDTKLNFGKYKGYTIKEVYDRNASYLRWALENTNKLVLSDKDIELIEEKAEAEDRDYLEEQSDYGYSMEDYYDHCG